MANIYRDGQYVELSAEEYAQTLPPVTDNEEAPNSTTAVRMLAQGLSQATTIAQIRAAAQQFLDETEGTA